MNEVLITVLGMMAAFITAFLAEPVKIYFQSRSKLKNLKVALYKEMLFNFSLCRNIELKKGLPNKPRIGHLRAYISILKDEIHIEYYKKILQTDLDVFYQLEEALQIHGLYGSVKSIQTRAVAYSEEEKILGREEAEKIEYWANRIIDTVHYHTELFISKVYKGVLDKKLLKKIAEKDLYEYIVSNGKQIDEKIESELEENRSS